MSIHIINPINPYITSIMQLVRRCEKGMLAKNNLNHRLTIASVDTHVSYTIAMEGCWEIPYIGIYTARQNHIEGGFSTAVLDCQEVFGSLLKYSGTSISC